MKKSLTLILSVLIAFIVNAQQDTLIIYHDSTSLAYDDSSYYKFNEMRDSVFKNLNFEEVTSNLLIDRGIFFINPAMFNGTITDTNSLEYNTFRLLYMGFYYAAIDTSNRLPNVDYLDSLTSITSNTIKIPVLNLNYHHFKENA